MEELIRKTGIPPEQFATLVHPSAEVVSSAKLGRGNVISFGARIGPEVVVADHVWVGVGTSIGHDCQVGAYTHFCDGVIIAGGVIVGAQCYLGIRAITHQYIEVGQGSLIGMGAVVMRNVPEYAIMSGNPAKNIQHMGDNRLRPSSPQ